LCSMPLPSYVLRDRPMSSPSITRAAATRRVRVLALCLALIAGVLGAAAVFHTRYWIGVDGEPGEHCLRDSVFLVDSKERRIGRGDYVAFLSRGMTPFYIDGTRVLKRVVGVAGDHILVDGQGVWVNGSFSGALLHVQPGGRLAGMGRVPGEFVRDEQVPAERWWVMGTSPRSFDSRYWGYISNDQIIGRARPLW
jgi:conjugal transfer pilin signal peptidase TrbI